MSGEIIIRTTGLIGDANLSLEVEMVIDTGFSGGVLLPMEHLDALGVAESAERIPLSLCPTQLDGSRVSGVRVPIFVYLPDAEMQEETIAFCPDRRATDILLGSLFLAQCDARLVIGRAAYSFDFVRHNPSFDMDDVSSWVIPFGRPSRW